MEIEKNRAILYGGAFNPPTIAHIQIIQYLQEHFKENHIILLPTNDYYGKSQLVSYEHRKQMLSLSLQVLSSKENIEISNYEYKQSTYQGTYYTLKDFHHPYFVIGADALESISSWIMYPKIIEENEFIVFPRANYSFQDIFLKNKTLRTYQNHFYLINDFPSLSISSTSFRQNKDIDILLPNIYQYIKEHHLYL